MNYLKLLKNKKISPYEKISYNNTIAHIAAINNDSKVIKYLIKHYPDSLKKIDNHGNSAIHLMLMYNNISLLKISLLADDSYLNTPNFYNETILHMICQNKTGNDLLEWIFHKLKLINNNINLVSNNDQTPLTESISKCKTVNDEFYKNIVTLLHNHDNKTITLDFSVPVKMPPLICVIKNSSDSKCKYKLINMLIKSGADVNVKNNNYKTPLIYSVQNNLDDITKLLIKHKADINFHGVEGDENVLNLSILQRNNKLIDVLLKNDIKLDYYNRYLETPVHVITSLNDRERKGLSLDLIASIIYKGDLNKQNINGQTPLHFFLQNYDWRYFNKILENKSIDIFVKDYKNKTPLDYISNNDMPDFINMIANNHLKHMNLNTPECTNNITNEKCIMEIKKHMLKSKQSLYNYDSELIKKFKIINGSYTNAGRFNSDTLHNMIYTIIILDKYKNLMIPFQYPFNDKIINDKLTFMNNDIYHDRPSEKIISNIVRIYYENFYSMLPYLILWKNRNLYYINKDLGFYLKKCLLSDKIRFIFIKLTLIPSSQGTHANILIFDKETGILERFEPYGSVPYLETDILDEILQKKFTKYFKLFLSKNSKKFTYVSPRTSLGLGFQVLSSDTDILNIKLGDPHGYCLAWVFWFLEMRIQNPKISYTNMIEKATGVIIDSDINKQDKNNSFSDFIRNYANTLDSLKNEFLLNIGIRNTNIYNLMLNQEEYELVITNITNKFNNIINERV